MSDLANWKVHGPVRTVRTESAEWYSSKEEWRESHGFTLVQFRPDGKVSETVSNNSDGSISRSKRFYDEAGQLRETNFRKDEGPTSKGLYYYDDSGRLIRPVSVEPDGKERDQEICRYDQSGRRTKVQFLGERKAEGYVLEGTDHGYRIGNASTITI